MKEKTSSVSKHLGREKLIWQQVRTTFQTLEKYLPAIENSLTYTLSNRIIEGTNNKIKNIKRSGYGYLNFNYLRYRILITQNLLVR
ncbi:transposase [Aerococcaceae bacterium DSM 111021]|nr:transposase [Aerococcaceae bacterium DSM 111021]